MKDIHKIVEACDIHLCLIVRLQNGVLLTVGMVLDSKEVGRNTRHFGVVLEPMIGGLQCKGKTGIDGLLAVFKELNIHTKKPALKPHSIPESISPYDEK